MPEIIDLFSGCGGLAYGFKSEGFKIGHGLEMVKAAVDTASYNLYWADGLESEHFCGDITTTETSVFQSPENDTGFIVIGGPPCQAYSKAGRAKLKSLGEDRVHTNDSRGYLFQDFLRFALELDAKIVVMENVPEATNYGGMNIPQLVCDELELNEYKAQWTILNAADFGVPQVRERVFVLASKKELGLNLEFPQPTHHSRDGKIPLYQIRSKHFSENKNFVSPKTADVSTPCWVTAEDAFSDLPSLFPRANSKFKSRNLNINLPYRTEPTCDYQILMRSWNGYIQHSVSGHAFRKTSRDFPIFERMNEGDDFRAASQIADSILEETARSLSVTPENNPERYQELRKKIVPPYDRTKFHGKWRKLQKDSPSHTVVAHLDTDTYSHIHPWESRAISVREAARLQSFPDSFIFQCSMGDAYRQIGNAVPPLLSKAIANSIRISLEKMNEST